MISNSSPLICLSKINQLNLLQKLYFKIIIPEAVKNEVLIKGKSGFLQITEGIESGWIRIKNPTAVLKIELGKGETEAISLAKEKK